MSEYGLILLNYDFRSGRKQMFANSDFISGLAKKRVQLKPKRASETSHCCWVSKLCAAFEFSTTSCCC